MNSKTIFLSVLGILLGLAGLFFPVIIDFYTKPSVQMPGDFVNGLALVLFWIFITMPIGGIIFFASLEYLINPKSFEKNQISVESMEIANDAVSKADKIIAEIEDRIYKVAFSLAKKEGRNRVDIHDIEKAANLCCGIGHWPKLSASLYDLTDTDWLELLGDIQQNESVDGNDIVREVDLHEFKILWSFESNYAAKEAFKQWYKQYQDYYDNPENYK